MAVNPQPITFVPPKSATHNIYYRGTGDPKLYI